METKIYENSFDAVLNRVEKARLSVSGHHIVKIVAASKYVDATTIEAMYGIGQRAYGENKIQDMASKVDALSHLPLEWHFIGRLQSNKINQLIGLNPFLMHSLSSLELALEIEKRVAIKDKTMNVLLQINSAYEEEKAGVLPEEALEIYEQIKQECPHLRLQGVMSIGAHTDDNKIIQESFEKTKKIFDTLQNKGATICSMGMSNDFELAIKCGSNMLRLGSVLFK